MGEHDSTLLSGVDAPLRVKTEPLQIELLVFLTLIDEASHVHVNTTARSNWQREPSMTNNCWPSRAPKKKSPESPDSAPLGRVRKKGTSCAPKKKRRHRQMNTLSRVQSDWPSGSESAFTKKMCENRPKVVTEKTRASDCQIQGAR